MKKCSSLFILVTLLIFSCDRELINSGFPSITVNSVTGEGVTMDFAGEILRNGDGNLTGLGFIWQADADPLSIPGFTARAQWSGNTQFNAEVNASVKKGQNYIVRAYAICGEKMVYSEKLQFVAEYDIPLRLISFYPGESYGGDTLIIRGKGFNNTLSYNEVLFDDSKSRIIQGTDTVLTCIVPYSTITALRTIKVRVNGVEGIFSEKHNTLVPQKPPEPVITSLSDRIVKYGNRLTVYGENLNLATDIRMSGGSQNLKVIPLSVSADSVCLEIYNHQNPTQLLGISSFRIGIVTAENTIWSDNVSVISSWVKMFDFPGEGRYKAGCFSLGGMIYVCNGTNTGTVFKDLWKLDPTTGNWSRMADVPGAGRVYPIAISGESSGYVGSGYSADNSSKSQFYDFYKYNPTANTWTALPVYPDNILDFFVGYSATVNGRAFAGLSNSAAPLREIVNDQWIARTSNPDLENNTGTGVFTIGDSFYVITGFERDGTEDREVWQYNTISGAWTRKSDFPGPARHVPIAFSLGKHGYYGCGRGLDANTQYRDMWRYDPALDKWIRIDDFFAGNRSHTVSASDGRYGYAGLGMLMSPLTYYKDFWKYDPE